MIKTQMMKNKSKLKLKLINCRVPLFDENRFDTRDIGIDGTIVSPKVLYDGRAEIIDAQGMIVSPGFIDIHSHGDSAVFQAGNPKIFQGVTTEVVGNCGLSALDFGATDFSSKNLDTFSNLYSSVWGDFPQNFKSRSIKDYYEQIESRAFTKAFMLMGYSSLRLAVSGLDNRPLTSKELISLEKMIILGFSQGSPGISFGMNYVPNTFARTREYALVSRLAAQHNRKLVFHIRDEGDKLLESLDEALAIADMGGASVHISHLKCHGQKNWHKLDRVLAFFDRAALDHEITFDAQPYTSGSTTLFSILPPKYFGLSSPLLKQALSENSVIADITEKVTTGILGWDNYYGSTGPKNIVPTGLMNPVNYELKGKSLAEIGELKGVTPVRAFCDILLTEEKSAGMILNGRTEKNVIAVLSHPLAMVGSDALYGPNPHPRTYGAFPRYFQRFIRELNIMPLINALERVTRRPTEVFRLNEINQCLTESKKPEVGKLEPGSSSDLVIFDENTIGHEPDFETDNPSRPEGIRLVISSGKMYEW